MLLYYMHKEKTQWRRTSIKFGYEEYRALCYVSQRLNVSPTSYLEACRSLYDTNKEDYTNFTLYVKNKVIEQLLKEKENDNK